MQSSVLVEPSWFTHPDYVETLGPEVGDLCRMAGFDPDPEQQLVLDAMLGLDKHHRYVAFEVCIVCSRQNLKTGLFKMAALGKAFLLERPLFVWSAHEFSTTQEAFRDLTILIESTPELDRRVANIYRGNGDEAILLKNGSRIKFKARTKAGGRGLTGDDVLLDEAFALKPEHMGALLPTLSARPDPQVLYGSSAGLLDSAVLRGIRDRGRAGSSPRLVYAEWGNDPGDCTDANCNHELGSKGCALDDFALIQRANPALGRRITPDYIMAERQALPPLEFARERLGWWDDPGDFGDVFSPGVWTACATSKTPPKPVCLGLAMDLDRVWLSLGVATADYVAPVDPKGDLEPRVRYDVQGPALLKETARIAKKRDLPVAIDARGPAETLIEKLEALGVRVLRASLDDYVQACADLYDDAEAKNLAHGDHAELNTAVANAGWRMVGDRRVWSRKKGDVSMLEAVTLARWGASNDYEVTESFL